MPELSAHATLLPSLRRSICTAGVPFASLEINSPPLSGRAAAACGAGATRSIIKRLFGRARAAESGAARSEERSRAVRV
ncbi:hypothetical protein PAHAL_9G268900 [Panicum hallii]|uniref:Uncharacterized protein n=1 Tax=Panicum hallii TaxID=206008 RepID=A0A2T8I2P5_9POAL|nr:hypothetical protein PAHAL_9G268900 [Panicum hallii]